MSKIFITALRLNLENVDDRGAWEYLRNMNRKRYKPYSSAIVTAINDHFFRQERPSNDPFLETRERQEAFLRKIKDTIREGLQTSRVGFGGLAALLQSVQPTPQPDEAMSETSSTACETIYRQDWYFHNTNPGRA